MQNYEKNPNVFPIKNKFGFLFMVETGGLEPSTSCV